MTMIYFDRVSKQYDNGFVALSEVTFAINAGELVFLTGHSGAGKSTLLKLLALLERPSSGQIVVGGQPVHALSNRAVPYYRRQLGLVFQDHQLLMDRTVFENVALPLYVLGVSSYDIGRRVRAILDKVGLLRYEKCFPVALSSGEQQRVGIARAMVHRPPILLADEPTGNLDPALSEDVFQLFGRFAQLGTAIIIASHDAHLIQQFDYPVLQLAGGHLSEAAAPLSGYDVSEHAVSDYTEVANAV